jgi:hypothetical protein
MSEIPSAAGRVLLQATSGVLKSLRRFQDSFNRRFAVAMNSQENFLQAKNLLKYLQALLEPKRGAPEFRRNTIRFVMQTLTLARCGCRLLEPAHAS